MLLGCQKKHDLRIYVTIMVKKSKKFDEENPVMMAYLHKEGLARFCTAEYIEPKSEKDLNDEIHLTNYSLNKHNKNYKFVENEDDLVRDCEGSKRTMKSWWKGLERVDSE